MKVKQNTYQITYLHGFCTSQATVIDIRMQMEKCLQVGYYRSPFVTEWPVSSFTDHFHLHLITYHAHLLLITTVIRTCIRAHSTAGTIVGSWSHQAAKTLIHVDATRTTTPLKNLAEYTSLNTLPAYTHHLFASHYQRPGKLWTLETFRLFGIPVCSAPAKIQKLSQNPSALSTILPRKTTHLTWRRLPLLSLSILVINSLCSTLTFVSGSSVTEDPTKTEDVSGPLTEVRNNRYGGSGFIY